MPIKFKCPKCGAELKVKEELAGRQGPCPACKTMVTVPRLAPARRQVEEIEELEVIEEEIEEAELVEDNRPRRPAGIKRGQEEGLDSRRLSGIKRRQEVEADEEDEEIEEAESVDEDEPRPARRKKRKKLGSLAQAARSKNLKQMRGLLLFIGIIHILFNVYQFIAAEELLDAELKKQGIVQVDPQQKEAAIRVVRLISGAMVALGVLYIVFAVIVHQYPVPITVMALVIYVGLSIIFIVIYLAQPKADPSTVLVGIPVRILIIVGLAKGIHAAVAYQKERDG